MRNNGDETTQAPPPPTPPTTAGRSAAQVLSGEQMREQKIFAGDGIPDAGGDVLVFDPTKPFDEMWGKANDDQRAAHTAAVEAPKA